METELQVIAVVVLAILYGLSSLSRRMPHVQWLQPFRLEPARLTPRRRAMMQRRANLQAGLELIMIGLGLPLLYVVGSVMMFQGFTPGAMSFVVAGSALCIFLGVTAIWRSR